MAILDLCRQQVYVKQRPTFLCAPVAVSIIQDVGVS
jgi:hypothetical protein